MLMFWWPYWRSDLFSHTPGFYFLTDWCCRYRMEQGLSGTLNRMIQFTFQTKLKECVFLEIQKNASKQKKDHNNIE